MDTGAVSTQYAPDSPPPGPPIHHDDVRRPTCHEIDAQLAPPGRLLAVVAVTVLVWGLALAAIIL